MKKIYKQILLALSVLLMVGCQNTNTKMKKVAIIQYMEHASLDTIKAAFDQQMENLGYKDKFHKIKCLAFSGCSKASCIKLDG